MRLRGAAFDKRYHIPRACALPQDKRSFAESIASTEGARAAFTDLMPQRRLGADVDTDGRRLPHPLNAGNSAASLTRGAK